MSVSVNFHGVSSMNADKVDDTSWLKVRTDDGGSLAIFMPYATAKAIADAFNATFKPDDKE